MSEPEPPADRVLSEPLERPPHRITDATSLARCCAAWRDRPAIAVDTEFVRERTFFAQLGLIQVGDGEREHLVDTVALDDLGPLAEVFADETVTKVFHACGEDLEVLHHRFGTFPAAVFDTQIAAALLGLGPSLGYPRLVEMLFDIVLPTDQTRTNWTRRPLTSAQERYAALDVAYLLPIYERFTTELVATKRHTWMEEDVARLLRTERFLPDPEQAYRRIKGEGSLDPRQRSVLRALAAWREREARRRDLPRNFVVPAHALLAVARESPNDERALARIAELEPRFRSRVGRDLLAAVRQGREAPATPAERQPTSRQEGERMRKLTKTLQTAVRERSETLGLAPETVASRRGLSAAIEAWRSGHDPLAVEPLRGWRADVVGQAIESVLGAADLGGRPKAR